MSLGAHYQQEVDLVSLFKDVSEFVEVCMAPAQARPHPAYLVEVVAAAGDDDA
jgi:hypothetical protein